VVHSQGAQGSLGQLQLLCKGVVVRPQSGSLCREQRAGESKCQTADRQGSKVSDGQHSFAAEGSIR
jgi:hypothetical protein